ncbi:roadblock/LC7 domain-containing protein [Nocardia tengchongensis]|uniref:roadblock/LC7 domain-containing protein n=1 Tax=Nocardia tengchongensis TaxID=2055889 RepID=UPI0036C41916
MQTDYSINNQQPDIVIAAVNTYLSALRRTVPHLLGSIVSAPDGLLIAEDLPDYLEPTAIAALAAAQTALTQRFAITAHGVDLHNVVIHCHRTGAIVIYPIGESASLTMIVTVDAAIDRIHREAQPVLFNLGQLLALPTTPTLYEH